MAPPGHIVLILLSEIFTELPTPCPDLSMANSVSSSAILRRNRRIIDLSSISSFFLEDVSNDKNYCIKKIFDEKIYSLCVFTELN